MKRTLNLILLVAICFIANAQKVDLDKFTFTANYRILPRKPLDSSYHTFDVSVKASSAIRNAVTTDLTSQVNILGWKRLNERAHISVQTRMEDVIIEKNELQQREEILTDKNGKETGRRIWYFQMVTYSFAAMADVIDYKGTPIMTIPLASRDYKQNYKCNEFTTSTESNIDYKYGQATVLNQIINMVANKAISDLSSNLTSNFGYQETTVNDYLWVLNTRKNPENDSYKQAWLTFKQAMYSMNANEPLDQVVNMMQPTIDYLNSLKRKYNTGSKADRKLRYSCFYNLAKIYYYLDMPDQALAEASALQVNDFDESDGKRLEAAASALKAELKQSQMHSRHFAINPDTYSGPYDTISNTTVSTNTNTNTGSNTGGTSTNTSNRSSGKKRKY
ncbi:MAG: hypothetical protein C5B52_01925 [Bacteroidetes bacterium]|nr:MAG: hypothetical protein C5B52_01925 [Bacteroidota bacterium]